MTARSSHPVQRFPLSALPRTETADIAVCGDIHCTNYRQGVHEVVQGVNNRAAEIMRCVSKALSYGERGFIITGDVFDRANEPPGLVAAMRLHMQRAVSRAQERHVGATTAGVIISGNHDANECGAADTADVRGVANTAVSLLWTPGCEVATTPQLLRNVGGLPLDVVAVPFRTGRPETWLPGVLEELPRAREGENTRVLVLHASIVDDGMSPWIINAHDAIHAADLAAIVADHQIQIVFAGNLHTNMVHVCGSMIAVQAGALTPGDWADEGLDFGWTAGLSLRDGAWQLSATQVPGRRYIKCALAEVAQHAAAAAAQGCTVALRVTDGFDRAMLPEVVAFGLRPLGLEPVIVSVDADLTTSAKAEAAAGAAAEAARMAQSDIADAVRRYCNTRNPRRGDATSEYVLSLLNIKR